MAEPEGTEGSAKVVEVVEEIEGEQIGTKNYRFSKIGEPVPIKSDVESEFHTDSLPSRPLAVSERFGLIFVAHSSGFCVARTKEVMNLAEEWKKGGNGLSIQELSVVDVSIGKVSILALSANSSTLAASIGSNLLFFSVAGLLNKEQEPSFSKSLDGPSFFKDMQWNPKLDDCYVVLSADGNLYHGASQDGLNNVMVNVDAVDWSVNGKFVAVAKSNSLSILSSKFKEKLRIMLSFKSFVGDSDENCVVKVDSVRWVRSDCIVLGCYQLNPDGTEENYLVQVITVKDGKITNGSGSPIALCFSDAFLTLSDDIIPFGSGPYMLSSYLDDCEIAFIANRKVTDQHIVLFGWSSDEKNEATMIEISNDAWLPVIGLQGNSEENLILGLAADKVSHDEKVKLVIGEQDTEVSPCCVLLCLTVDGKLFMFHFASATGPSVLPEDVDSVSDEEEDSAPISSELGLLNFPIERKQVGDHAFHGLEPQKAKVNEPNERAGYDIQMRSGNEQVKSAAFSQLFGGGVQHDVAVKPNDIKDGRQPFSLASTSSHGSSGSFSSGAVFASKSFDVKSSPLPHTGVQSSKELSGNLGSNSLHGSSRSLSSGALFSSKAFDLKSSALSHAGVQGNRSDGSATVAHFPSGPIQNLPFAHKISAPSTSSSPLGQGISVGAGTTNSLPVARNAKLSLEQSSGLKIHSYKGNQRTQTPSRLLNSEPNLSEQCTVEEMAKELDALLESIVGPGGFYDASVALQKTSVVALEDGIRELSDRCQMWTRTMDQRGGELQLLLDKTVQVLARKIYMEAIVKQATDSQYWDIWNRQKLSSELEMKRRHILEINQNLTNQLIELERHLNTLELQRFGDNAGAQMNHKSFHSKHVLSRHIQSLHSLHNTMNAQLTAAEKLSECLSKQMAALSIEMEPVKKQDVKKELFETIGISYNGAKFGPPGEEKARDILSEGKMLMPSCSTSAKAHLKKSQPSNVKTSEPETARRHRDSLDRNWASFEPPKTTVKRMLLQEDREMSPGRLSLPIGAQNLNHRLLESSAISHDSQGRADTPMKGLSEGQSNSSLSAKYLSDSSKTLGSAGLSLGSRSQLTSILSRDTVRDSRDPTAERSRSRLTFHVSSDSVAVNDLKSVQQSRSFLDQPSSNTTRSLAETGIFQKKPIEFSESRDKDTVISKPTTDGNQGLSITESSSLWSRKSQESSFSTVSGASLTPAFSGKSSLLEASIKESQSGELVSSSSSPPVTSAPSSFIFKETAPTSASDIAVGRTGSGFKLDVNQAGSLTTSSVSSFPSFSSATSFQAPKESVASSSTKPSVNIDLDTSQSVLSKSIAKTSESSTQVVSEPKRDSRPDENSTAQTSPPQTTLASGTNSLKLEPSVPSGHKSEPPISPFSGSLNLNTTISPASVISNSIPEQPLVAPVVSSPVLPSSTDGVGGKNASLDVTLSQEDEMEEEAPETTQLTLGNLGGFGSAPNPSAPKQNPFGAPFGNAAPNTPVTSFSMTAPSGGLFRPASFNIQSPQPSQPSQQTTFGAFSSGFPSNTNQSNTGQGFGQPAQLGSGQQALGSVLGSFGQSRQLGTGLPGSVASPSPFGSNFGGSQSAGGFAAASGGGFASLASGGGGFGALAAAGGGFAAAATSGGGFAAAAAGGGGGFGAPAAAAGGFGAPAAGGGGFGAPAAAGGGFGAPAAAGGFGASTGISGFAGAASGGFGAFSSQGGSGAFSTFGSTGGTTGRPPSELFTQMRK